MTNKLVMPIYAKVTLIFIGFFALITTLIIAQNILVPVVYAIILAIVLSPIVNFLVKKKMNRTLAISITLSSVFLLLVGIVLLLFSQLIQFTDSFPLLIKKSHQMLDHLVEFVSKYFNLSTKEIERWISIKTTELLNNSNAFIAQTILSMGNIVGMLFLIPVYIFLMLYYQPLLLKFVRKLFSSDSSSQVSEVITSTKKIIQSYLVGLMIEALIVAILNSTSLLIIGVEYAILLGTIGAFLNMIPYIGGIVALTLNMLIALVTMSPIYALFVFLSFLLIQLVDNNFILPKIVASRVKINALVSIIIVIIGGAIWGVSGMFLAIPILAIIKVIFDHVESLKPWGYLIGDTFEYPRTK